MNAQPILRMVYEGGMRSIACVVRATGESPAFEFWDNECAKINPKGKANEDSTAKVKFLVYFRQMGNAGRLTDKHFGREMDGLYAFKAEVRNLQIRFPCFRDGSIWILTHGFVKPGAKKGKGKWPESEVARAKVIRDEYWQRKQTQKGKTNGDKRLR